MNVIGILTLMIVSEVSMWETDERYGEQNVMNLAEAIEYFCEDYNCVFDALATCWIESRCQMNPHATLTSGGACGPFQQIRRYADHPDLVDLGNRDRCVELRTNPFVAVEQFLIKKERYEATRGQNWPMRYYGGENQEEYLNRFRRARMSVEAIYNELAGI